MNVIPSGRFTADANTSRQRMDYRADIDGLRAIAVLAVVFYHAGLPGFSGGFVGVDVFFVISGFLITGIVAGEVKRGDFSILRFYDRRIRRIFPALIVMLATVTMLALFLLLPDELRRFGSTLSAAALFYSNIVFAKSEGYFGAQSIEKPLLHLWSLAIEEQFYIVWPLLLGMVLRSGMTRRRLALLLLCLFGLSLAYCEIRLRLGDAKTFYNTPARAWELLTGAILALGLIPTVASARLREGLAALGLLLIALSIFGYDGSTLFPGLHALLPCFGAGLLILAGTTGSTVVSRLLSLRIPVFIGLVSYPLYLWHWPLLSMGQFLANRHLETGEAFLIVCASFGLAVLSWRFVERPLRHARAPSLTGVMQPTPWRTVKAAGLAILATVTTGLFLIKTHGLPMRLPQQSAEAQLALQDVSLPPNECRDLGLRPNSAHRRNWSCYLGDGTEEAPEVILWGDSHAAHAFEAIRSLSHSLSFTGALFSSGGCPPLVGTRSSNAFDCLPQNNKVLDFIRRDRNLKLVILSGRWPWYSDLESNFGEFFQGLLIDGQNPSLTKENSRGAFDRGIRRTIDILSTLNVPVLILGPVPEYPRHVPRCVMRAYLTGRDPAPCISLPREDVDRLQAYTYKEFSDVMRLHKNVFLFSPLAAFCDAKTCTASNGGKLLWGDSNHLTTAGSRQMAQFMDLASIAPSLGRNATH